MSLPRQAPRTHWMHYHTIIIIIVVVTIHQHFFSHDCPYLPFFLNLNKVTHFHVHWKCSCESVYDTNCTINTVTQPAAVLASLVPRPYFSLRARNETH